MQIRSLRDVAVGERLVVRYRLAQPGPGGSTLSDALGLCRGVVEDAPEGAVIRIETRHGVVAVPLDAVTHAKLVPPPPPRRR
ncbi:hypothetical protein [Zhihengliuella sp.]|uniref:hypothetical protein n=1 Tax=Zhihengliuella sp. TaxID=1954483 RepID=UPI0028126D8E|nr:hypothetical protein [Zhihengliuella sp.]